MASSPQGKWEYFWHWMDDWFGLFWSYGISPVITCWWRGLWKKGVVMLGGLPGRQKELLAKVLLILWGVAGCPGGAKLGEYGGGMADLSRGAKFGTGLGKGVSLMGITCIGGLEANPCTWSGILLVVIIIWGNLAEDVDTSGIRQGSWVLTLRSSWDPSSVSL